MLRIAGEIAEPFAGKRIPFYYLSELGEQETIRGFTRGRFRDNDVILSSLEYRYPIWRRFDAGLFVDFGQVSPNVFENISRKDFHTGFGGTLYFWLNERAVVRFIAGRSKERTRLYFSVNKNF